MFRRYFFAMLAYMLCCGIAAGGPADKIFMDGYAKLLSKQYSIAQERFEKGLSLEDNPLAHFYLGFAFKGRGWIASAQQHFKWAYTRLPQRSEERKIARREMESLSRLLVDLRRPLTNIKKDAWRPYVVGTIERGDYKYVFCFYLYDVKLNFKGENDLFRLSRESGAYVVFVADEWRSGKFNRLGQSVAYYRAYLADDRIFFRYQHVRKADNVDPSKILKTIYLNPDRVEPLFSERGVRWKSSQEKSRTTKAACSQSAAAASIGIMPSPGEPY
ncbi:MAG: hypothetical protein EOS23_24965 [Mesorhizobium sp.]|nr:MAG: hypothetical protein EOS23_24965 [Mesorhizobium sp.]